MKKISVWLMFLVFLSGFVFLFSTNAYAYLDPGTGSMILQGILGGLAAAVVVARLYWNRLLVLLGIRKDSSSEEPRKEDQTENSDTHGTASNQKPENQ